MRIRFLFAVVAATLVLAACGDDEGDERGAGAVTTTTAEPTDGGEASTDPGGPTAIAFSFAADEGEAACSYEGPAEVGTAVASTAVNAAGQPIDVTLARLADDAAPEDFEAYLRTLGDRFPVDVPPAAANPAAHEWMQGDWLELHAEVGAEPQTVERSSPFPGRYVAFCYRSAESGGGSVLWPAGSLTVVG